MDTPASDDKESTHHLSSGVDSKSSVERNYATVSAGEIGIGIACAAGISYALTRKRKQGAQAPKTAKPDRKIDDDGELSLPHKTILFLKL